MPLLSTLAGARGFGRGFVSGPTTLLDSFQLIDSVILNSNSSSVTFSNLNSNYGSTYKNLQLRVVAGSTRSGFNNDPLRVRFNGSSSGYYYHAILADQDYGIRNASGSDSGVSFGNFPISSTVHNSAIMDIVDAFSTSKFKTTRTLTGGGHNNSGYGVVNLESTVWQSLDAITSIQVISLTNNSLTTNSRISLYGLKV